MIYNPRDVTVSLYLLAARRSGGREPLSDERSGLDTTKGCRERAPEGLDEAKEEEEE
jgi:hypothetical protein